MPSRAWRCRRHCYVLVVRAEARRAPPPRRTQRKDLFLDAAKDFFLAAAKDLFLDAAKDLFLDAVQLFSDLRSSVRSSGPFSWLISYSF